MLSMLPIYSSNITNSKEFFELIWNDVFCDKKISLYENINHFNVDLKEIDDYYILEADLPGITRDDITINYISKFLVISAKRIETSKDTTILTKERSFGEYKRMFYLDDIDITTLKINYKNGELTLNIKKKK